MVVHASRQEERSAATRRALLDATIACLVEEGHGGTTGPAVAKRAGLSRGAQLHHFGTRDQMVVAAVEHLAQMRLAAVGSRLQKIEDQPPTDTDVAQPVARAALELLAGALSGPLYAATLELWVAARANAELREELVPAEQRVRVELWEVCRRYVTEDPDEIQLTLDLLLGQGVSGMFHADRAERHRNALDRWERLLDNTSTSAHRR